MEYLKASERLAALIEKQKTLFSKSQKKIASHLLSDYEHAAFLTASELADRIGVSEATIVRFANTLGFEGFPQFRKYLQDVFREKVSPAVRMQNRLEALKKRHKHILTQIVEMETHYISEILHSVSTEDFDRAVHTILQGNRLFLFGIGHSRILAELMQLRLQRFGILTIEIVETGRDLLEKLILMKPKDVLLAAAYHRITGELCAVLRHAQSVGCPTVILTDIPELRTKGRADVVLFARRGPIHSFHSHTVPMTILNAIILAIAAENPESTLKSLQLLEEVRKVYGLDPLGELP